MTSAPAVVPTVHGALIDAAARLDGLLRAVTDPKAVAVGHWTVEQTVAHLTVLSYFDALTCREDVRIPPELAPILDRTRVARIADIESINAQTLELFTERDLPTLAEQISMNVGILALVCAHEPGRIVHWLGELPIPVKAVAGHYIGEIAIHGYDIARSQGLHWDIPESDARIAFDDCYIEVLRSGAHMMWSPSHKPVSVAFEVPGAPRQMIDIGPGRMSIGPSDDPADVVLSADAVTTGLMMFERINPFAAVLSGRLKVGGRRPWRVLRFRRQLRMP